jgi:hypothetical protein
MRIDACFVYKGVDMSNKDVAMLWRGLPQSIAGEVAVLGSIIIEPACLDEITELICVEAFGRYEN